MGAINAEAAARGRDVAMPSPVESALLARIEAYRFDEGEAALPFADRLARENGWSKAYAGRVIEEYRRFMFLTAAAGHPVTPSDQVDQAWHLHLQYSRSYWEDFCRGVLQRAVHHQPTLGGPDESRKFVQLYERTLASYRRYYGEPPADIWPAPAIRFGDDLHHARVNLTRNVVISRAWLWRVTETGAAALLALILVASFL